MFCLIDGLFLGEGDVLAYMQQGHQEIVKLVCTAHQIGNLKGISATRPADPVAQDTQPPSPTHPSQAQHHTPATPPAVPLLPWPAPPSPSSTPRFSPLPYPTTSPCSTAVSASPVQSPSPPPHMPPQRHCCFLLDYHCCRPLWVSPVGSVVVQTGLVKRGLLGGIRTVR